MSHSDESELFEKTLRCLEALKSHQGLDADTIETVYDNIKDKLDNEKLKEIKEDIKYLKNNKGDNLGTSEKMSMLFLIIPLLKMIIDIPNPRPKNIRCVSQSNKATNFDIEVWMEDDLFIAIEAKHVHDTLNTTDSQNGAIPRTKIRALMKILDWFIKKMPTQKNALENIKNDVINIIAKKKQIEKKINQKIDDLKKLLSNSNTKTPEENKTIEAIKKNFNTFWTSNGKGNDNVYFATLDIIKKIKYRELSAQNKPDNYAQVRWYYTREDSPCKNKSLKPIAILTNGNKWVIFNSTFFTDDLTKPIKDKHKLEYTLLDQNDAFELVQTLRKKLNCLLNKKTKTNSP